MNINEFQLLEPIPIRDQIENNQKDFYPTWNCFCCQDSGKVSQHLIKRIIPSYNPDIHLWAACQNTSCNKFRENWRGASPQNFDMRFSPLTCQKLDLIERENWYQTIDNKQEIIERVKVLSQNFKMGGVKDRTENDNREIQQRKQEVENYHWAAASTAYLGSE
jgi:hypothetical protein